MTAKFRFRVPGPGVCECCIVESNANDGETAAAFASHGLCKKRQDRRGAGPAAFFDWMNLAPSPAHACNQSRRSAGPRRERITSVLLLAARFLPSSLLLALLGSFLLGHR